MMPAGANNTATATTTVTPTPVADLSGGETQREMADGLDQQGLACGEVMHQRALGDPGE